MKITTLKETSIGWSANGDTGILNNPIDRNYQAVQEWITGGGVVEPEFTDAELLATKKTLAQSKITQAFDTDIKNIVGDVTIHVIASWRKQEDQARAWLVDNTIPTPTIDGLLSTRALGETKAELVTKVIANADAYETAYAPLLGKFQARSRQIDAVFVSVATGDGGHATVADALAAIEAIVW